MRVIPIVQAKQITGTLTQTSKMPCKSYSLPTLACHTGFKMAQIEGSICASCYADKGFYKMYANIILPAQMARLDSINDPLWIDAMVSQIGTDHYFRWHDSGDLQSVDHLIKIAKIAEQTPNCQHWLPTREYKMVSDFLALGHKLPQNLHVKLSAMYPDKPVTVPKSLQNIVNISTANVHKAKPANGFECQAPKNNGACLNCRACWQDITVSYAMH